MAEPRQNRGPFQIQVSYSFDRLLEPKLAQAYELLVPCREHPVGVKEFDDEDGGNLRKSVVRAATRGADDREPDTKHSAPVAARTSLLLNSSNCKPLCSRSSFTQNHRGES